MLSNIMIVKVPWGEILNTQLSLDPPIYILASWSDQRESNPHPMLGRRPCYRWHYDRLAPCQSPTCLSCDSNYTSQAAHGADDRSRTCGLSLTKRAHDHSCHTSIQLRGHYTINFLPLSSPPGEQATRVIPDLPTPLNPFKLNHYIRRCQECNRNVVLLRFKTTSNILGTRRKSWLKNILSNYRPGLA